ncbi:hypothetical protein PISL3812_01852 [Talaromyces islandicus]|uniref:Uncharacterized protein n=1 Tax=Talaromyces islandicus TaxID=28573 RepID=A0A0U1LN83_TALIS|nr:hypothetical protein PISL3812_01852 [Talaromyces islandicus]
MNTTLTISSSAAALMGLSVYIYYLHRSLDRATHRLTRAGAVAAAQCVELQNLESVNDADQIFGSGRFFSVYERAWRVVPKENLPGDSILSKVVVTAADDTKEEEDEAKKGYEEKLLTAYLRHNMFMFSRYLPQSYLIWLMITPNKRSTFGAAHIQNLRFCEGDVVCGMYKVLLRRAGKVEFGIDVPDTNIEGRLVVGICRTEEEKEGVQVYSETVMWRPVDRPGLVMPLERALPRFMHELAAWWLLDSGVKYLVGLGVNKDV